MQHLQIGGRVYDLEPFYQGSNTKAASDRQSSDCAIHQHFFVFTSKCNDT